MYFQGIRKRKASESDPDSADFGQKKRRKAALSRIVIPRRKKKEVERAAKPRKKVTSSRFNFVIASLRQ